MVKKAPFFLTFWKHISSGCNSAINRFTASNRAYRPFTFQLSIFINIDYYGRETNCSTKHILDIILFSDIVRRLCLDSAL